MHLYRLFVSSTRRHVACSSLPARQQHVVCSSLPARQQHVACWHQCQLVGRVDSDRRAHLITFPHSPYIMTLTTIRIHTPGTRYRLTLDLGTLYTPLKNTSKHTCLDSLRLKPPAPLYPLQDFKVLYKYCIIIILLLYSTKFMLRDKSMLNSTPQTAMNQMTDLYSLLKHKEERSVRKHAGKSWKLCKQIYCRC